jgi:hypothetical protein
MRGIGAWWQERKACRENAAYLEAEVQIIDLVALERERERELEMLSLTAPDHRVR